jgi:hypothetical protein
MKFYRCDGCSKEFDSKTGMIDGWYVAEKEAEWVNPDKTVNTFIIRRTIKLYHAVETGKEVELKKDLCPACIKKLI